MTDKHDFKKVFLSADRSCLAVCLDKLFGFYSPVNTAKVISSWSVNLLTFFQGRLSPLSMQLTSTCAHTEICLFVCVAVLRPSQPNEVMSSTVSLPNHTFTGQA